MSEIVFMSGILIYFILVVRLSAHTHTHTHRAVLYLFEKEEPSLCVLRFIKCVLVN